MQKKGEKSITWVSTVEEMKRKQKNGWFLATQALPEKAVFGSMIIHEETWNNPEVRTILNMIKYEIDHPGQNVHRLSDEQFKKWVYAKKEEFVEDVSPKIQAVVMRLREPIKTDENKSDENRKSKDAEHRVCRQYAQGGVCRWSVRSKGVIPCMFQHPDGEYNPKTFEFVKNKNESNVHVLNTQDCPSEANKGKCSNIHNGCPFFHKKEVHKDETKSLSPLIRILPRITSQESKEDPDIRLFSSKRLADEARHGQKMLEADTTRCFQIQRRGEYTGQCFMGNLTLMSCWHVFYDSERRQMKDELCNFSVWDGKDHFPIADVIHVTGGDNVVDDVCQIYIKDNNKMIEWQRVRNRWAPKVEPGQPVWLTYWLDGVKTIQGKISSVNANGTFLHDIPTEPGMSGSVIWDEFGRIAGIHKAADSAPYNKAVWLNAAMILRAGQMALPKNFQPRNIK
jgi:hypothetical protein